MPNDGQKDAFQERLGRLSEQKSAPSQASPEIIDKLDPVPRRRRNYVTSEDTFMGRLGYPLSIICAFILGIFSVFLSRYIRYHMLGAPTDGSQDTSYLMDVIIAGMVAAAISQMLRFRQKEHLAANSVGVIAGASTMHNLVWLYPGAFMSSYGVDWVESVLRVTDPYTVILFGMVLAL